MRLSSPMNQCGAVDATLARRDSPKQSTVILTILG
jgi:hypothetical protein